MAVRQPNFLPTHLVGGWPWPVMLYDPYHPQSCSPAPQLGSLFSPYPSAPPCPLCCSSTPPEPCLGAEGAGGPCRVELC